MRIFKHRLFCSWAKSQKINDCALKSAIHEIEQGLFDAVLGNGLYKKRMARGGQGKRNSYRTIIVFKLNDRAIFLYGYGKNERSNITEKEKCTYQKLATYLLKMTDEQLSTLIKNGKLFEVL